MHRAIWIINFVHCYRFESSIIVGCSITSRKMAIANIFFRWASRTIFVVIIDDDDVRCILFMKCDVNISSHTCVFDMSFVICCGLDPEHYISFVNVTVIEQRKRAQSIVPCENRTVWLPLASHHRIQKEPSPNCRTGRSIFIIQQLDYCSWQVI